ncbi:hypothetical protein FG386_003579 [Cryptosporidium ryanae]|uniref:uncharacterized protein n=1 Tax=Cryptosporidium ryanae TaxID=515981 RepID=UPI00351A5EEA|nr:hypothetical protein FG386_003579 [Cryptosporidium ryanae]
MGSDISCQTTGVGDICYNQAIVYNGSVPELLNNYYIFNNEVEYIKEREEYFFSCLNESEEVSGSLICDLNANATISCGYNIMTFRHRNNCSFGFMFRPNETLIFQSNDLNKPIISFPSISNQIKLYSSHYNTDNNDRWALREGYKGGEFESLAIETLTAKNESWNGKYLNALYSSEIKFPTQDKTNNYTFDNNGSLSFILPIDSIKSGNLKLSFTNKEDNPIVTLDISKCCSKLIDNKNNKIDRYSFISENINVNSVNLTISWISPIVFLYETTSVKPLSVLTSVHKMSPTKAKLTDANNNEILTNWYLTQYSSSINPNYCVLSTSNICKSSEINISKNLHSDSQYLRYGFMFSETLLAPYVMNIKKNSNKIINITFKKNLIIISTDSETINVDLKNEIEDGDWVSGDIFILSKNLHRAIIDDTYITCKEYNYSCLDSQDKDWMSKSSEDSILRYAYLKKEAVIYDISENELDSPINNQIKDDYYIYISYKNCIVARIGTNNNYINNLQITNAKNVATLSYWRINTGISPSIAVPSDKLATLRDNIKNNKPS